MGEAWREPRPSVLLRENTGSGHVCGLQGWDARGTLTCVPGQLLHLAGFSFPDLQMGCHGITVSMKLNHRKRGSESLVSSE